MVSPLPFPIRLDVTYVNPLKGNPFCGNLDFSLKLIESIFQTICSPPPPPQKTIG